ncbi:MAG: hypothetical protein ACE5E6_06235 [Phycisphaerae bacterium]
MDKTRGCWCCLVTALALGPAVGSGCRDDHAPLRHNKDLGTTGVILMPVSGPWTDPAVARGSPTDWRDTIAPPALTTDAETATASGETRRELRALLAEYNELLADYPADDEDADPAAYFVERQQDTVTRLLELRTVVAGKMRALTDVVEASAPQARDTMDRLADAMMRQADLGFDVEAIELTSDTEAVGKLVLPGGDALPPGLPVEFKFVRVDDEWFFDMPAIDMMRGMIPMIEASLGSFDTLIEGVRSGTIPADTLVQQLTVVERMVSAAEAGAAGTGDRGAETTDNRGVAGGDADGDAHGDPGGGDG